MEFIVYSGVKRMNRSVACEWKPCGDDQIKAVVAQAVEKMKMLKNGQDIQRKAVLFKALGDETRLKIIGMLHVRDLCLCEIVAGLNIPSSTITHHLQILERGDVVDSRKEGKYTVFSLNKDILLAHTIGIFGE